MNIKELPLSDRPYEKLELYGPEKLSESELLAIILKSGTKGMTAVALAQEVLSRNYGQTKGLEFLNDLSLCQLQSIKGIGKVKAIQLKALGELMYRRSDVKNFKDFKITCSADIAEFMIDKLQNEVLENVVLILLNKNDTIMSIKTIAKGATACVNFSFSYIVSQCIKNNCKKIALIHNHPSGESCPSVQDLKITNDLIKTLNKFEIELLDHIIIGKSEYYSIADNID